jgi:cardiolipin synthase
VWFLCFIGLVSLVLVLANLFSSLTEAEPNLSSTVPLEVGSPDFVRAIESVTHSPRIPVEGEITVFNNGTVFLADLLGEIGAARGSVTITNYIFEEGRMTTSIFDALIEAARRGVQVRVLTDGNGGRKVPEETIAELTALGGRVAMFRPLNFRSLSRVHKRTHVRAIVVDGATGYTGGLAFDDGWFGQGVGKDQWRDVMFKYGGALAGATQDQFNALWRSTDGEILSGPDFFPLGGAPHAGDLAHDSAAAAAGAGTVAGSTVADGAAAPASLDALSPGPVDPAASSWFVPLFHSPVPDVAADLYDLIWLSIAGAREHIKIATPYMVPEDDILTALMDAARRGVRVEVLMPGPFTDAKLIQAATRARYDELLDAGILIFEYQPGRFHEKTLTVDGFWSLIGSANMDNRSATLNVENVFGIQDRALAAALEQEFELGKAQAKAITSENWRPNFLQSAYHNAARVFAKQY